MHLYSHDEVHFQHSLSLCESSDPKVSWALGSPQRLFFPCILLIFLHEREWKRDVQSNYNFNYSFTYLQELIILASSSYSYLNNNNQMTL